MKGNCEPQLATKSRVSLDWLVWLCSETPVVYALAALLSRQK